MPEARQVEIIREFRARVARGDTDNLRVTVRISGGAPSEQSVREELTVSGRNTASIRMAGGAEAPRTATRSMEPAETTEVLREVAEIADELVPRSEARFIPDSTVGTVTLEVDGQEVTLFYLADEEQRQAQGKTVSPQAARALDDLSRLSRRILQQ